MPSISLSSTNIDENIRYVSIAELTTLDSNSSSHTYSLVSGQGDSNNSAFRITSNQLYVWETVDYEKNSSYQIRVQSRDNANNIYQQAFTISVNDINENPTNIILSSTQFDENKDPVFYQVASLSTIDYDYDSHVYSLVSGSGDEDNSSFKIVSNYLYFQDSPNYETKSSYNIRLETKDSDDNTYQKAFTISINDINEAPTELIIEPLYRKSFT
mgnify:CR=1 FL=1